ncbi:hypothetical protein L1D09_04955 [Vibrio tubiashii]|uniref:hypothetical protein n=2 Tax=Vibrio tubiashii TaxID=29498 RepID=UPI001EFEC59F|nr:hypothetical protein [Vibrio tubiashii]MCG9580884.1 hypothetical protein [Vibrio tubiashii]MCG9614475.1 hypothetical protein [Vibrio tubiashii]
MNQKYTTLIVGVLLIIITIVALTLKLQPERVSEAQKNSISFKSTEPKFVPIIKITPLENRKDAEVSIFVEATPDDFSNNIDSSNGVLTLVNISDQPDFRIEKLRLEGKDAPLENLKVSKEITKLSLGKTEVFQREIILKGNLSWTVSGEHLASVKFTWKNFVSDVGGGRYGFIIQAAKPDKQLNAIYRSNNLPEVLGSYRVLLSLPEYMETIPEHPFPNEYRTSKDVFFDFNENNLASYIRFSEISSKASRELFMMFFSTLLGLGIGFIVEFIRSTIKKSS